MVSDLWATRAQPRFWRYSSFRLTNGPLSYTGAAVSADGRQILAIGTKRRGELLRYDAASSRFIPFLGGISATRVSFSRDGKWIAYLSYPDHVLWRSRVDGSELRQLTYPPTVAVYPCISPDGTKVAYNTADDEVYIIDIGGGQPDKIAERSFGPTWSPDGSAIAVTTIARNKSGTETNDYEVQTINLKTRSGRILPASQGKIGAFWLSKAGLVAATVNATGFVLFDFASAKWSTLVAGAFVSWWVSTDGRYLYYSTAGAQDPKILRVYIPDRRVDLITTLKGIRRPRDPLEELDLSVAPDGSPIITRDIGHQEIYALTVKWP
jgi:hypothetical protein